MAGEQIARHIPSTTSAAGYERLDGCTRQILLNTRSLRSGRFHPAVTLTRCRCVRMQFDHKLVYRVSFPPLVESTTDPSVPCCKHTSSSWKTSRPSIHLVPYPPTVGQQIN